MIILAYLKSGSNRKSQQAINIILRIFQQKYNPTGFTVNKDEIC